MHFLIGFRIFSRAPSVANSSTEWRQAADDVAVATRRGEFAGFIAVSGDRFTAYDALARPLVTTRSVDDARTAVEMRDAVLDTSTGGRGDTHTHLRPPAAAAPTRIARKVPDDGETTSWRAAPSTDSTPGADSDVPRRLSDAAELFAPFDVIAGGGVDGVAAKPEGLRRFGARPEGHARERDPAAVPASWSSRGIRVVVRSANSRERMTQCMRRVEITDRLSGRFLESPVIIDSEIRCAHLLHDG
ncbi:hypothetical protein F8O01_10895 [Pseudoclavibacter chungangensis]|uniref:Uncharacterized protein n=1 Tax=Pseudoclavibacter chungangensis TaxID=587635 RepID=A0A7J5BQ76_9MICO|nr:hypothetical protein [Pseudoclavibacter chungangensis]KAB1655948.1 hypothetical protein F8O01_10895 [Pseudoclavibacter chungangensis]NYJ66392.1 hypothetical protein [Pseudoclavibacter chungangensis]